MRNIPSIIVMVFLVMWKHFFLRLFILGSVFVSCLAIAAPTKNLQDAAVFIEAIVKIPANGNTPARSKTQGGSGFLIHEKGWIISAKHLFDDVPDNSSIEIYGYPRSRAGQKYLLERFSIDDADSDVVLLRFPPALGIIFPYLCVEKHPRIQLLQNVFGIGFPLRQDFAIRPGQVTSFSGARGMIQTNMSLARGMSGGAVLSEDGAIIGVISGGLGEAASFDYFTPVNLALTAFNVPPAYYKGETCENPATSPTIERSYLIDETYDEHPGLSPTYRSYHISKNADAGYLIKEAHLRRVSDSRVSDVATNIANDKRSVDLTFKLQAGPAYDRWRGWLHAELVISMEPQQN